MLNQPVYKLPLFFFFLFRNFGHMTHIAFILQNLFTKFTIVEKLRHANLKEDLELGDLQNEIFKAWVTQTVLVHNCWHTHFVELAHIRV